MTSKENPVPVSEKPFQEFRKELTSLSEATHIDLWYLIEDFDRALADLPKSVQTDRDALYKKWQHELSVGLDGLALQSKLRLDAIDWYMPRFLSLLETGAK